MFLCLSHFPCHIKRIPQFAITFCSPLHDNRPLFSRSLSIIHIRIRAACLWPLKVTPAFSWIPLHFVCQVAFNSDSSQCHCPLGQDKRIFTNNKAASQRMAMRKKAIIKPHNDTKRKKSKKPSVEKSFCVNFKAEPGVQNKLVWKNYI